MLHDIVSFIGPSHKLDRQVNIVKFFDRLKKSGNDEGEANQLISRFNEERSKKRIEIENTPHIFFGAPTLRSGAVVIFTPQHLKKVVSEGQWLRIRVSDTDRRDVRLQITSAKHGGTGAMATTPDFFSLLCKIPGATVEPSRRASDRYTTVQYKDLLLDLSSPAAGTYPVMDLSARGLKIYVDEAARVQQFGIGEYFSHAKLRLGTKASIDLKDFIPRAHFENSVGMEFVVNPNSRSNTILNMFLDSLASKAKGPEQKSPPK